MKKLKTGIGCLIFSFLFFMAYHSQAQTLYVYDEADLLSEAQEQNLQGWAEEKKETEKQNFVFLFLFSLLPIPADFVPALHLKDLLHHIHTMSVPENDMP